jgi:uncharacterized protein
MTVRRWVTVAVVAAAVTLLFARGVAQVYSDYAWYRALGALDVWEARITALALLRIGGGVIAATFAFVNFYAVRQSVISLVLPRRVGDLAIGERVSSRRLTATATLLAVLVGLALSASLGDWSTVLLAHIGIPFHETDPYFSADLGFFVYWIPFEQSVFTWFTASVVCVTIVVVLLYVLTPGLRFERGRAHASEYVRRHLGVLGGVMVLLLAWHFRLGMYEMLWHGSGPGGAFTSLDHRVGVPGQLVLAVATLAAGLIVIWSAWTGQSRVAIVALCGIVATALVTRQIIPLLATHAAAEFAPSSAEYEATRDGYTRRAYAADRIVIADSSVLFTSVQDAADNVSAWDAVALARAVEGTLPSGRGARVGWMSTTSGLVGVVASPQAPPAAGEASPIGVVVRTAAADAGDRGTPWRILTGAGEDDITLLPPALVLDSARGYLVVADTGGRVAGMSLGSPLSRLAQALSVQNLRLAFHDPPEPHPKLLTRRSAQERVGALAPFFVQGSETTPLVVGDSLFWTLDLYSAASTYPLSQTLEIAGDERSYFHHAATALVLASTGEVRIIGDAVVDPIAASWFSRFPQLFRGAAAMPRRLLDALPPALDAARAQALAYAIVGSRANGGSPRHPPIIDGGDSSFAGWLPVYALPRGGPTALEIPILDLGDHVRGLVIAEGGPAHRSLWVENRGPVAHWPTVLERLRSADSLSRTSNATVVRGVVRAFALRTGIAFAQPIYHWSPAGAPALAHVTLLAGDSVRVASTFRRVAAPAAARGPGGSPRPPDAQHTIEELYRAMRDALRRGDWVAFGRAFDALGLILSRPQP